LGTLWWTASRIEPRPAAIDIDDAADDYDRGLAFNDHRIVDWNRRCIAPLINEENGTAFLIEPRRGDRAWRKLQASCGSGSIVSSESFVTRIRNDSNPAEGA